MKSLMIDLTNKNRILEILKKNNLWAKKQFGQNFLISRSILTEIIAKANIKKNETILEIGSGLGVLTDELAKKAKIVFSFEKDFDYVLWLRKFFKSIKNVKIIHEDILTYDLDQILDEYRVIANLPYNITSPTIRKFLESKNKPKDMMLMVQKEVAGRICAKAGNSNRGLLTLMVEYFAKAQIIQNVNRENFFPAPKVDSAIIELKLNKVNDKINYRSFMRLVKIGFSQKRRQIHNTLSAGLQLPKNKITDILKLANIDSARRAEDLQFEEWIKLLSILEK